MKEFSAVLSKFPPKVELPSWAKEPKTVILVDELRNLTEMEQAQIELLNSFQNDYREKKTEE